MSSSGDKYDGNGWDKWQIHVLKSIDEMNGKIDSLTIEFHKRYDMCNARMNDTAEKVTELKSKNNIFSVITGVVSAVIAYLAVLITYFRKS